jgi:hypothetical protein
VAAVAGAAAGDALIELLGLNKSASVFLAGDGDGEVAAVVFFVLRVRFSAGEGDASVAAADEAVLVASVFL